MGLLSRIFRFFFPKDFMGELKKGIKIGQEMPAKKAHDSLYDAGKKLRKKVDPEHKMKVGKKK